ncbi:uncharacterized protein [Miscanthus floridulus]|uniref:uncharacterized protein n=1 Tax=Miscanthus floridulus TaxID=154761 RepID=UPI003458535F
MGGANGNGRTLSLRRSCRSSPLVARVHENGCGSGDTDGRRHGGWRPAPAAGLYKAPEAKNNSSYGGTRVEATAHAAAGVPGREVARVHRRAAELRRPITGRCSLTGRSRSQIRLRKVRLLPSPAACGPLPPHRPLLLPGGARGPSQRRRELLPHVRWRARADPARSRSGAACARLASAPGVRRRARARGAAVAWIRRVKPQLTTRMAAGSTAGSAIVAAQVASGAAEGGAKPQRTAAGSMAGSAAVDGMAAWIGLRSEARIFSRMQGFGAPLLER